MLEDLMPYEVRKEYYTTIQLGRDVHTQTTLLRDQTRALVEAHAASTNAVIASNEGIREDLGVLTCSLDEVKEGIYGLKAAFEFGISEVVWQIEQNRQVLKGILDVLMAPLDTQSKELRRRAEDAYANGWFNDAIEDFLESEKKNKYDFTVHISLGMLYLFQKVDRARAADYFEKAVKYGKPKSAYHASIALLYLGLIKRDQNLLIDAERLTAEAIFLTPGFVEAHYQNAQYNGKLNNIEKCLSSLETAIHADRLYCLKADKDEMFDPVRNDVNKLFERLRDELKQFCINSCKSLEPAIKDTNNVLSDNQAKLSGFSFNLNDFSLDISGIKHFLTRDSYFDCLDAHTKTVTLIETIRKYIENSEEAINNHFSKVTMHLDHELHAVPKDDHNKNQALRAGFTSNKMGCLGWFLLCLFSQWIFSVTHYKPFLMLIFITSVGGWFIAKAILMLVAPRMYPTTDFSQFTSSKTREKEDLKELQNKLTSSLIRIKSNTHILTA